MSVAAMLLSLSLGASATPNVVLILLDDVAFGHYGPFGVARTYSTPHIDSLAEDGARFPSFYVNAPVCTPSRAAILTGCYPQRFGFWKALSSSSRRGLPEEATTLAEVLGERGYATAHIGKWHLGYAFPGYRPDAHGFDEYVLYRNEDGEGTYHDPRLRFSDGRVQVEKGHLTTLLTDHAVDFLRRSRDRPFFLNLWYRAAHARCEPPAHWAKEFPDTRSGRLAALMSHVDEQIGRVLQTLDELDLAGSTVVLLLGDNGSPAQVASGKGRAGSKGELTEGGLRSPLLLRWNGVVEAGREVRDVAYGFDLAPTLAELAGGTMPSDGVSLVPLLLEGEAVERPGPVFFEVKGSNVRGRHGDFQRHAARQGRWKLLGRGGTATLHDMEEGGETVDVARRHAELVKGLQQDRHAWRLDHTRFDLLFGTRPPGIQEVDGAWLFHDQSGGWSSASSLRWIVDDGDLSVRIRVRLEPTGEGRILAEVPGSWRLTVLPAGPVRLRVAGQHEPAAVLRSQTRLTDGRPHDVVFTCYGMKSDTSTLSLYVDGELQARDQSLRRIAVEEHRLVLGGEASGRPFRGRIEAIEAWQCALEASEIRDLAAVAPTPGPDDE